jgi:phospholipid/cholesterol/gamma-HCH transport system permease protein
VSDLAIPARRPNAVRRMLARLGRSTHRRAAFGLTIAALTWGVAREAVRPASWRRTVRAEFRHALRLAITGGVAPTLVSAALIGLTMISQALYWFREVGEEALFGDLLVTILMREVCPILVGLILLGRSGMVTVAELGILKVRGGLRALEGQGLDPFTLLLLPRACALAVAAFTLAIVFLLTALVAGYALASLAGAARRSLLGFLEQVTLAMHPPDFVALPAKMVLIGVLVSLTTSLTGLSADPRDDARRLLPRGFVRGILAVLLASAVLSLAV